LSMASKRNRPANPKYKYCKIEIIFIFVDLN
jgi:hypothetical protein